jgi:uncharacterized protein YndB with AHSA1/START domain
MEPNLTSNPTLPKPQAGTGLPPGTVQVSVFAPASRDDVWAALTQRERVSRWFGDLSDSLQPGRACRLDFSDGDFFDISDVVLHPPHHLSYHWRFLGTGPSDSISWTIEPQGEGCRITVTDREDNRVQATVNDLIQGWTDFLGRLQSYCATGRTTRYSWRREFDGSIELPVDPAAAADKLLTDDGLCRWVPWSGAFAAEATVTVGDGQQPAYLEIGDVERASPFLLRFSLGCPEWRAPTLCSIMIQGRPEGALLVVSHQGWEGIDGDGRRQGAQRERFGKLWTEALQRARRALVQ